ncbi:MAG: gliding motility-associated C-terminal domain-containing protein [Flavobacteriales bacterium]
MKHAYSLCILLIAMAGSVFGQTGITPADDAPIKLDCPQFPLYDYWDRNCLIKTAEPYGEIRLPQAGVDGLNLESPMWLTLPVNKPGWALSIAHAWNLHRNYIQKVNYPKISYYEGILGIETGLACTCEAKFDSLTWPWTSLRFDNWDTKCKFSNPHEGCFQMEEYNAWGQLNQILPYRFPCEGFNNNIPAHRFENQAIALTYRNVYNHMTLEYSWNTRLWEIIENPACDPYAYEKLLAVGWNSWIGGIYQNIAGLYDPQVNFYTGRAAAATHNCWDLAGQFGFYPDVLGWNMAVLEGNTSYCQYQYPVLSQQNNKPAGTQNHKKLPDFDCLFQWSDVSAYIDTVCNFYYEYSMAVDPVKNAEVKKRVKAVFDQLGGGGTVNFKRMGPVVDEIILCFPKEVPLMGSLHDDATPNGYRGNWFSRCPGNYAPASHIENRNLKKDTICIGQTLVAAAVIDGGEGPNLTYKWKVNGVLQAASDSLFNFSSNVVGDFMIQLNVCDPKEGGCADANCFMRIHVSDCKVCNLLATSSAVNTPCQNSPKGRINLTVTGSASYTISYDGPYKGTVDGSGATASITGLVDGVYNITITDKADPTCKFLLSQEVKYDVAMNNKLMASIQTLNDCDAKLKAEIEQTNCHCEYTVKMQEVSPDRWERYVFFDIIPSTGGYETFRGNVFSNTNTLITKKFSLCTGDKITVEGHILPASGSCDPHRTDAVNVQKSKYEVWLVGPDGTELRHEIVQAGVIKQNTDFVVFEHTVNCPFTPDPYTYLWTPGNLTGTPVSVSESKYIDKIYTVVATNTNHPACTLKDTVLVPFKCHVDCVKPDSSVITPGSLSLCKDSVVTFKGNQLKAYEYRWYKDGVLAKSGLEMYDFISTGKGNYQLVITDTVSPNDSLCMAFSDTVKFKIAAPPTINISGKTKICEGDSTTLTFKFTGAPLYALKIGNNNYSTADSLKVNFTTAKSYLLKVTDGNACSSLHTLDITVTPAEKVRLPGDTILCAGQDFVIRVQDTYSFYSWSTGRWGAKVDSIIWKDEDRITVNTTDANGCKSADTMLITLAQALKPDLGKDTALCGTSLTLSAAPDFKSYLWNTGATTNMLVVTTAGDYTISTKDEKGCASADTITVSLHSAPSIAGMLKDKTTCPGLDVSFNELKNFDDGSAPYTYLWQDGSAADTFRIASATVGEEIRVALTNKYGCVSYDTAAVTVSNALAVNIRSSDADKEFCFGDSLVLSEPNFSTANGYTFSWQNGASATETYHVKTAGKYKLEMEKNGCKGSAEIDIKVNQLPVITLAANHSICNGDSVALNANAGVGTTLLWDNGKTGSPLFVKTAGRYIVTATNTLTQCKSKDTAMVAVFFAPVFTFNNDSLIACEGTVLTLMPSTIISGPDYLWSNGAKTQSITFNTAGNYWLKMTDPLTSCAHSDTVNVSYTEAPVVNLGKDTTVCETGIDLNAGYANKPGVSYLWSTGQTSRSIYVTDEGAYSVKVSIGTCSASDTMEVGVVSGPVSELRGSELNDLTPCFELERNHVLKANDDPKLIYTWFINGAMSKEKSNSIGVLAAGKYEVFISNGICPLVKDEIKIKEYCPTNFFVPNAFILGRTGENGAFKVYGNVPSDQYSMMVFNRWGELIFESYNPDDQWDGTYNGHEVQQDVYVWKITYRENQENGKQLLTNKIGHVTVLGAAE